ncbi:DUF4136 domain-containing protein [Microbulbifer yueqingensis]|uniref:Type IV secretion system putative lipoprotein virB7 n=1 Tax=Microbulbifer yueqingensis TaxID=658219 RepID=A0A1G8YAF9_9GAMM|nr:DUF4136 domain-containing protein [Microbulbifer yueqingensis]SDJ99741.1 protein of unknown function [Microbulbifer yueqingensis]
MRKIMLGFVFLALVAGCQAPLVERVQPAEAPVSFSTYAWGMAALGEVDDASAQLVEMDNELRQIVDGYLRNRGYRQVDEPESADMVVSYQVAVVEGEITTEQTNPGWDAQFDSNAPRGAVELPTDTGAPRLILTLEIGRSQGAAIWGGTSTEVLGQPEDAPERQQLLANMVRQLLSDLPPAAGY